MKTRAIITVMAAAALASCNEKTPVATPEEGMVSLQINIALPQAYVVRPSTRTIIDGTVYNSSLHQFSMCADPEFDEYDAWYHSMGYNNITGYSGGSDPCTFRRRGAGGDNSGELGFFSSRGPVKLYAAYPTVSDLHNRLSDLDHIPFTVDDGVSYGSNYDYMYMVPITFDPTGMAPGEKRETNVVFKHIMTAVELRMQTTMVGTVFIDSIRLEAFDGDERARIFARKGTYSIIDGSMEINSQDFSSRLCLKFDKPLGYKNSSTDEYATFPFVFPAVGYEAGRKIKATIFTKYINNGALDMTGQENVVEFRFDDIITDGVTPTGLKRGYRYVYKMIAVDNFIKYSGYPEIEDWVFDEESEEHKRDIII